MKHPCKFHCCRTWCQVFWKSPNIMRTYVQNFTVQEVHIEKERVLPTLNCRTWWETAHNLLQHSTWVNIDTCPFCTFVCPQLVWNKSKKLFFAGPNAIFPGLDNRQTCFTLDTKRRCSSNSTSSEQGTRPTFNVTVTLQLWTLILLSATDSIMLDGQLEPIFQRFSSNWSPRSYPYVLFRSWLPTIKKMSLSAYQPSLQRVLCMPRRLSAYFKDCCWQW
jgi:hypothetical protein